MLSIAKLRVGQEAYQLSGVAQSLDDYYTGAGEASGVWVGGGAARLGLAGDVEPDDLRAVLAGLAPGHGGLTPNHDQPRPHPRQVPGFDLTFKAPKSASVLYAVSDDPRVQGAVIEAGEAAMRAAVGWLEREAARVQRGSHNLRWLAAHAGKPGVEGPSLQVTSGVVAAAFRHRTSRAGDPLLHWHVLVANLAEGTDGRWSALQHPNLYRHARAAGELFQAVFRDELTVSLGVEWRPGAHVPEIAGIPQALLDRFSKRTAEIDAWLAATGTPDTPEGRQAAVLATRRHKPEVEGHRFDEGWKAEAEAAGWGPDAAERLVGWSQQRSGADPDGWWRLDVVEFDEHGRPEHRERVVDPEEWITRVLRSDLTAAASTFTEADLVRAVAARQGRGATLETVERIASRVLASDQVIAVATPLGEAARWTSRELADVETRFLAAANADRRFAGLHTEAVDRAIAVRPSLGHDQLAAVRTIAAGGHPVSVLVGPAGTGKTFTLDTIRAAFEHAGHSVVGAAPSARAALELAGAGIPARTLHSLLDQWRRGHDAPTAGSLLVVDEAGMADIRTLEAAVTAQLAAGGRVLLVGDHHQLPEIGAGGGFAAAVQQAGRVAELTVNRRQRHPWEQEALTALRDGSVAAAVDAYLSHDRVLVTDSPQAMITTAVDRWFAARDAGLQPVLLAGTNDLVDRLNQAVITRLAATGELDGATVSFGAGCYRVGERVVVRRNSTENTVTGRSIDVANGQAGTVVAVAADRLTVRLDGTREELVLTDRYLRRGGHLNHAYALTTHRAQGGTWDLAIAVGADGLYREGAYVELSRGAAENWLVLTEPDAAQLHADATRELERHDTGLTPPDDQPPDTGDELVERMTRSHAKQLAHHLDPDLTAVDHLSRTLSLADLQHRAAIGVTAERMATDTLGYHGNQLTDLAARVEHVARHLAVGAEVSPADRHNVGTVTALHDATGQATVHFASADGHEATRIFDWVDLRIIHGGERSLPLDAATRLDAITATIQERLEVWQSAVRSHGAEPGDAQRYSRAAQRHIDRVAHQLTADQPAWLQRLVGHRPADVAGATTWDDTVHHIAHWRALHALPAHTSDLGPRPTDPDTAAAWGQLHARLGVTRSWLASSDRIYPADTVTPSRQELLDRRDVLDELFEAAPPDWRATITRLQCGQLSLDDTADLLQAAHAGQQERRDWILRNWPHVVEYQEINRTLTTGTWGPDTALLTGLLTGSPSDTLAHAITRDEPWLRVALNRIADAGASRLDDTDIERLEQLAAHRADRQLQPAEPIDSSWWTPDAAEATVSGWWIEPAVEVGSIDL